MECEEYEEPTYYIYGIFNDATHELVYVGRTQDPAMRFKAHRNTTAKDFRDNCYMEIFEEGVGIESVDEGFWIRYAVFLGCNLANKNITCKDTYYREY